MEISSLVSRSVVIASQNQAERSKITDNAFGCSGANEKNSSSTQGEVETGGPIRQLFDAAFSCLKAEGAMCGGYK